MEKFRLPESHSLFDLSNRNSRTEHNDLDLQIIEEQKKYTHYNPFTQSYRYKVYDKATGDFKLNVMVPKLTSKTYLVERNPEKLVYKPFPYRKYSPRQIIWWLKRKKETIIRLFVKFRGLKIWSVIFSIFKGVFILLIAYTIWGLLGEKILTFFRNLF